MGYQVTYKASVKKELRKLHPAVRRVVVKHILSLASEPRPMGSIKLQGAEDLYRIRQGTYRIIYTVYDELVTIEVVKVGHRSDVYR